MDTDAVAGLVAMVAFPVVFIGMWVTVGALLGLVSGWWGLAARFPETEAEPRYQHDWTSGNLRFVNYRNVLKLGLSPDALHLGVLLLFRVGHPPLRVPRAQVEDLGGYRFLFLSGHEVRLGGGPVLRVYGSAGDHLRAWLAGG